MHLGGEKQPNDFGLYDTLGNVLEWTQNGHRIAPPPGGTDPNGAVGDHEERIVFGGRFSLPGFMHRAANLSSVSASSANARGIALGLRLVRTLPD